MTTALIIAFTALALIVSLASINLFGRIPLAIWASAERNGRYTGLGSKEIEARTPPSAGRTVSASPAEILLAA
jgi:hypothetical protein